VCFGSQINLWSGLSFVHKKCLAPPLSIREHFTCILQFSAYKVVFLGRTHRDGTCYYITGIISRTESEPLKPKQSKPKALTMSIRSVCLNLHRAFPHLLTAKPTTSLALAFYKKIGLQGSRIEREVLSFFVLCFVKNSSLHFTRSK